MSVLVEYEAWERWAEHAPKDENGWESDYPEWESLMRRAEQLMERHDLSGDELQFIDACFAVSHEGEQLADFAEEHIDTCFQLLVRLTNSQKPATRWQVYSRLPAAGVQAREHLEKALGDADAYCRQRAELALNSLAGH